MSVWWTHEHTWLTGDCCSHHQSLSHPCFHGDRLPELAGCESAQTKEGRRGAGGEGRGGRGASLCLKMTKNTLFFVILVSTLRRSKNSPSKHRCWNEARMSSSSRLILRQWWNTGACFCVEVSSSNAFIHSQSNVFDALKIKVIIISIIYSPPLTLIWS